MKRISIKICGMRDAVNISETVKLEPDYIGFILYLHSPRFIQAEKVKKLKNLIPSAVRKVGVIVNEPLEKAIEIAGSGSFDMLQLHGNESIEYCKELSRHINIIKAFRIEVKLPDSLPGYEPYCSLFLFDSSGDGYGGNGIKFDHRILDDYNLKTNFLVGGGISARDTSLVRDIRNESFEGLDINSRFEIMPGIKDLKQLKKFIEIIRENNDNN